MGLFDLQTTRYAAGVKKSRYIEPRFEPEVPVELLRYAKAREMAKEIGNVSKGRRIFALLNGTFIFGDFLEALIVENNWQVKELTISTLSMSEENVDSLAGMLNGNYVLSLNLIVSDFFFAHERGSLIKSIYQKLDKENRFQLAVANVHTKIALIETIGGNRIVIHGSANLRTSGNVEQIAIENNDDLYGFLYEVHRNIKETYKTINKHIPKEDLWEAVQGKAVGEAEKHPGNKSAAEPSKRKRPSGGGPEVATPEAGTSRSKTTRTRF